MSAKKAPAKKAPAKPKPKTGRPVSKVDPELVEKLAGIGCPTSEIAALAGCSIHTLARRFEKEIDKGRENGKTRLRKKQIEVALAGNVAMLIWLGKQMLAQSDRLDTRSELTHRQDPLLAKESEEKLLAWIDGLQAKLKAPRK